MKKIILPHIAVACLLGCVSAQAGFYTGQQHIERAASTIAAQRTHAIGYVAGTVDVIDGTFTCIPEGVTVGQLVEISSKWITKRPEQWHKNAGALIMFALRESFPCPQRK